MNKYEIISITAMIASFAFAMVVQIYQKKVDELCKRSIWWKILMYTVMLSLMTTFGVFLFKAQPLKEKATHCRCCGKKI